MIQILFSNFIRQFQKRLPWENYHVKPMERRKSRNSSACKLFPVQEHMCNPDVSVFSAVLQVAAVALMRSNMCMEAGPGLGGALLTPKGKETPVICGLLEWEFGKIIPVGLSAVFLGTLDQALCVKPGMSIRSSLLAVGLGTAECHSAKDTHKKKKSHAFSWIAFQAASVSTRGAKLCPVWPNPSPSNKPVHGLQCTSAPLCS